MSSQTTFNQKIAELLKAGGVKALNNLPRKEAQKHWGTLVSLKPVYEQAKQGNFDKAGHLYGNLLIASAYKHSLEQFPKDVRGKIQHHTKLHLDEEDYCTAKNNALKALAA